LTEYEPTIGIEAHAQLLTTSKMFCSCSAEYAFAPPNSLVCPVCLGMPGSLPVINRRAVEYAIMTGLAFHCQIAEFSKFDRKNYNYPDLVKGYQISQYDLPICHHGWTEIEVGEQTKRIGIQRVHLEEDTGKLIHMRGSSLIDFNRSGVPLIEIVTAPDFCTVEEVREYAVNLRRVLRYLGVSSGNMEEGALRIEVNVSLHPMGSQTQGTLVELKNLNSFRAVWRSLEYEIKRQEQVLCEGGSVQRETRGWDDAKEVTFPQRSKEQADDYRYFPEPDLPPLEIARECIEQTGARMPELPDARRRRFSAEYTLSAYDAGLLTDERAVADYYEQAVAVARGKGIPPKAIANWVAGELFHLLHAQGLEMTAIKVTPEQLAELVALVNENTITAATARHVLAVMSDSGEAARDVVAGEGLAEIADQAGLASIVDEVIAGNSGAVAQYRDGKETVLHFLIGQVMRATHGKADPGQAAEALKKRLAQ
jgi:aspartyl-tRNA(Asn)/glutamyl-tRNA(Gln) amidotransferase subunit B